MSNHTNSVKEVTLASVPKSTFANPQVTDKMSKHAWTARFNVACWLRVHYAVQSPISLKLLFKDSRGWQQVFIDEGFINSHNRLLLSGAAAVQAVGPVVDMKVNVAGISSAMRLSAEELFVQRIQEARSRKASPAAAA